MRELWSSPGSHKGKDYQINLGGFMFVDRQEDYSKVLDTQRLTRIQKAIIDEQKKIQNKR